MLPEESLVPAPTVSDIDGADNEVPVATRRSDPECRSVVDTVFMRLANWTMHWEVDSWCDKGSQVDRVDRFLEVVG